MSSANNSSSPTPADPAEPDSSAGDAPTTSSQRPRITRAAEAEAMARQLESDPDSHSYECRGCGYRYEPAEGVAKLGIARGTGFTELPDDFLCPVCRSPKAAFVDVGPRSRPSGFTQNLNYGLGVNRLTPSQKTILIFGGLVLAAAFLLSFYSLH